MALILLHMTDTTMSGTKVTKRNESRGECMQSITLEEQWKDIEGYEDLYQISNLGRVRSLKKWCGNKHIDKWESETRILTPFDNGNGYLVLGLRKDRRRKNFYVHRLVATHFIENSKSEKYVNHKDFNTHNNNVDNLEWCTQKENVLHSIEHLKHRKSVTHTNTGEKYISYRKSNKAYRVTVDRKDYGTFKTLEAAIQRRDEVIKGVI